MDNILLVPRFLAQSSIFADFGNKYSSKHFTNLYDMVLRRIISISFVYCIFTALLSQEANLWLFFIGPNWPILSVLSCIWPAWYPLGEKMYPRGTSRRRNVKNSMWHRLYNVTAYDLFLSDTFSLLEDMNLQRMYGIVFIEILGILLVFINHFFTCSPDTCPFSSLVKCWIK